MQFAVGLNKVLPKILNIGYTVALLEVGIGLHLRFRRSAL